ncbi:hypothetical protein BT93_H1922 [Corymbia citriodora subsp. variegata]|nr:hypothetical protein BT93_H1922 [Corymbia citriodora subsp. variegata]
MELFESLGVEMEISDISFSVSLDEGRGCEWGSRNGLSSLFAQKTNVLNPYIWQMLREIIKFKEDVLSYLQGFESNPDMDRSETLGQFIKSRGYSELFQRAYLIPICGSIWSYPSEGVMSFSAFSVLSFCRNHHLLQVFGRPQWLTVRGRSRSYVNKVRYALESRGCEIRSSCEVQSISTSDEGCIVLTGDGSEEVYDACIVAVHAPDALRLLGDQATYDETRVLGAFQYAYSEIYLHHDKTFMPKNPAAWSARNFLGSAENKVCLTYWLNVLQNLDEKDFPFLVTLNPSHEPEHTLLKWSAGHPIPSVAASEALLELHRIQGKRGIWFCGAYQGYGFHEDGLKAGMAAAHGVIGQSHFVLENPQHMVPSLKEIGARFFVTRFLRRFISTGSITLLEEGGTMFTFKGITERCPLTVTLRIHSPQFYWKVMTQADLGLADAYINGDFSFVDKDKGLLNLFQILIVNRDSDIAVSKLNKKRGWWTPMLLTAGIASAKYFLKHVSRQNTLTQARRNISQHYDLSNKLFSLFLDETMTYSCAVFKVAGEDLKMAQMRKISLLIKKARIEKTHEVLEIGCGWGSLAIEVDSIKFLLCDYRQLPSTHKYDRIISCEMIEAVGHEYMEEFFGCCESVLAKDGLLVLQFTSMPDERYDQYRRSSDFIKDISFPGAAVEHVDSIGIHFYQTLRCWRKNFMEKQRKILAMGFNEKFIRMWEYYFDYCAAGFKTNTLGNYQIVFSRPGTDAAFVDSYVSFS